MSVSFYVVRHAETDWNALKKLQGHSDIALNQTGKEQAQGLLQRVQNLKLDLVISSDLIRARQTAEIAFPQHTISTEKALREVYLGAAEGMTRDEILLKWGEDFWNKWASTDPLHLDVCLPQGESKREMLARVLSLIFKSLDQNQGKQLAFVSHGLVMRSLVHHFNPTLTETHFIQNCGVLKIKRTSKNALEVLEYYDQSRSVT